VSERPDPDDIVAALRAAESDDDRLAIEAEHVADTAEEDPGEVEAP